VLSHISHSTPKLKVVQVEHGLHYGERHCAAECRYHMNINGIRSMDKDHLCLLVSVTVCRQKREHTTALGADIQIVRDRTILVELSIAEKNCWYTPSLTRHRLNLRERCYCISCLGACPTLVTVTLRRARPLKKMLTRYVIEARSDTAHRHYYWSSVGTSPSL